MTFIDYLGNWLRVLLRSFTSVTVEGCELILARHDQTTVRITGLVPRPSSGAQSKFLRGDATWQDALGYVASSLPSTFESSTGAYIKFENGLLLQWGSANTTLTAIAPDGSQTVTVTFPLPYVDAKYYTTVASPLQSIPVIVTREERGDGSYAVFRVTNKSSGNVTNRNFVWWALGRWK